MVLQQLSFDIPSTKTWKNYRKVWDIQNELIAAHVSLNNYFKVYALNQYIIGEKEGCELLKNSNKYAQNDEEITSDINADVYINNRINLLNKITEYASTGNTYIIINSKAYKRDRYQSGLIKKYRGNKCQFYSHTIRKQNGEYYIEASRITSKLEGGDEKLENILVLYPNCHKLFDLGSREKNRKDKNEIFGKIKRGRIFYNT
jgi:predicted restriction endonuclease